MPYWYNVDSGQVETDDNRSQDANVMGPYDSQEAAANALRSARENTEKWDREDKEWGEGGGAWDPESQED
ncbi:methionine aminopeptidase [Oryzobacter terrae]|uniref:methionine aminopeptidase n=1 Tax=Oryzobacter terrae TaxID=1620385 RepID=UPI00367063FF